jgi:hypothetical protein
VLRLDEAQLSKTITELTKSLQPKERKKRDDAKVMSLLVGALAASVVLTCVLCRSANGEKRKMSD